MDAIMILEIPELLNPSIPDKEFASKIDLIIKCVGSTKSEFEKLISKK